MCKVSAARFAITVIKSVLKCNDNFLDADKDDMRRVLISMVHITFATQPELKNEIIFHIISQNILLSEQTSF